ncbi:hypothetical protein KC343_g21884, partial [Hortaea werneckii]
KSRNQGAVKLLVEKSVPGGKPMKVPFIVQPNIIEPHDDMPSYSHFVNIKSNFLAPNVTTLQHWPYFGDDFDYSEDAKGLKEQYSFDMDQRSTKLLRLAQAQKFACPYHGEIEELEDSDEEADSETKKAITTDIINPPAVNNRKRVGFNPAPDGLLSAIIEPLSRKDPKQASYWEKAYKHKADERGPFYP